MSSTVTPYAAAKIVNAEIKNRGVEKVLRPQMFYNYAKKGYIKSSVVEGKILIERDDLLTWFNNKYAPKNLPTTTTTTTIEDNVDENQIEMDLDITE